MAQCNPNSTHWAIAELFNFLRFKQKRVTLITQNIDGFDKSVIGADPDLCEIHGNTHYMRCMFECCSHIFDGPPIDEMVEMIPCCPACGALARPNVLLFGENYNEELYRSESALRAIEECDCMIVMGTQLHCALPAEAVRQSAKLGKLIIEINIEPVIKYGNVLVLPDRCGSVFPPIVDIVRDRVQSIS